MTGMHGWCVDLHQCDALPGLSNSNVDVDADENVLLNEQSYSYKPPGGGAI